MPPVSHPRLPYYCNCVSWPPFMLPGLEYLVDHGQPITRQTWIRHIDVNTVPAEWWPHAWDYAVSYHRLPVPGLHVYWYDHSSIEFVFAEAASIREVVRLAVEERRALTPA